MFEQKFVLLLLFFECLCICYIVWKVSFFIVIVITKKIVFTEIILVSFIGGGVIVL